MRPATSREFVVDACDRAKASADAGHIAEAHVMLDEVRKRFNEIEYFLRAQVGEARAYVFYCEDEMTEAVYAASTAKDLLLLQPSTGVHYCDIPEWEIEQLTCDVHYLLFLARLRLNQRGHAHKIATDMMSGAVKNTWAGWSALEWHDGRKKSYLEVLHSKKWNFWYYRMRILSRGLI